MAGIVVGVDRSETAKRALVVAGQLAASTGEPLRVVSVVPRTSSSEVRVGSDSFRIDALTHAEEFVADMAKRHGGPTATWSVHTGDPGAALCAEARDTGAAYIVVGNRRAQGPARVLGSVATDVVRHAPCHVVVANTTAPLATSAAADTSEPSTTG